MMKFAVPFILAVFAVSAKAFGISPSRRELFQQVGAAASLAIVSPAQAIEACPKGSKNCIVTVWTPPDGTSKKNMALAIRSAIYGYPKNGK